MELACVSDEEIRVEVANVDEGEELDNFEDDSMCVELEDRTVLDVFDVVGIGAVVGGVDFGVVVGFFSSCVSGSCARCTGVVVCTGAGVLDTGGPGTTAGVDAGFILGLGIALTGMTMRETAIS